MRRYGSLVLLGLIMASMLLIPSSIGASELLTTPPDEGIGRSKPAELVLRLPFPANVQIRVSQTYNGYSHNPQYPYDFYALDLIATVDGSRRVPVVAAAGGTVLKAGSGGDYGTCVVIDHGTFKDVESDTYSNYSTLYAHMEVGSIPTDVKVGERVRQGQTIGIQGDSGWVEGGALLHFALRSGMNASSISGTPVVPEPLVGQAVYEGFGLRWAGHNNGWLGTLISADLPPDTIVPGIPGGMWDQQATRNADEIAFREAVSYVIYGLPLDTKEVRLTAGYANWSAMADDVDEDVWRILGICRPGEPGSHNECRWSDSNRKLTFSWEPHNDDLREVASWLPSGGNLHVAYDTSEQKRDTPVRISFDVFDLSGNANYAPHGTNPVSNLVAFRPFETRQLGNMVNLWANEARLIYVAPPPGTPTPTPTTSPGDCSYVEEFSFSPASPSDATEVDIHVRIKTDFPNFRAARLRVEGGDGPWEFTVFDHLRAWDTRNTPDGDHTVVLEIDDNQGPSWDNPVRCTRPYHLDPRPGSTTGIWHAEYFDNWDCWWDPQCSKNPSSTEDFSGFIAKNWTSNLPSGVPSQNWSARFRGTFNFSPGNYVFHRRHDDGVQLRVDGQEIFGNPQGADEGYTCPPRYLSGDHELQVNYLQTTGDAYLYVDWSTDTSPCNPPTPTDTPIPPTPTDTPVPPTPTDTPVTPTPTDTLVPQLFVWSQEAEEGVTSPPMAIGQDAGASGCYYVSADTTAAGDVVFAFDVPASEDYYPWARAMGQSWGENSFYVSIDGGAEFQYEIPQFDGQWRWGWGRAHADQQPAGPFPLSAGNHTIRFRGREPNARLDVVLWTNSSSYVPTMVTPCDATPTYTPVTPGPTVSNTPSTPGPTATNTPLTPVPTATYTPITPMPTATNTSVPPTPTKAISVALPQGWSLASFNLEPRQGGQPATSLVDVLASIEGSYGAVLGYDGGALSYYPHVPAPFNSLRSMDYRHGYWLYMSQPGTWQLTGLPVSSSAPIPLSQGWNLVSYLPEGPLPVAEALVSIERLYSAVMGYDGGALTAHAILPAAMNSLQYLEPHRGYWIKMTQPGTLIYPATAETAATLGGELNHQAGGSVKATNQWISFYGQNSKVNGKPIPQGATVTAYDPRGYLVGEFAVRHAGWIDAFPVYGDDPMTKEIDGARRGEKITFRINGHPAAALGPGEPTWTAFGDLVNVDLSVIYGQFTLLIPLIIK